MIDSGVDEELSTAIADLDAIEVEDDDDLPDLETALDALATAFAHTRLVDEGTDLEEAIDTLMQGHSLPSTAGDALIDIETFVKELKYVGGAADAADELTRSKDVFCAILRRWAKTRFGNPDDQSSLPLS